MKKFLFLIIFFASSQTLFAKKVKFAVDMSPVYSQGDSVHATGIHVYGNFQGAAGYPFDWDPGSIMLSKETSDTNVYSIVLDIPAFLVYEYRFINGDQAYQVEFVPNQSRVNGNFDDNRWLYVDSLANDTTFVGVMPFSANAPTGLTLLRFRVNMVHQSVSPDGVHVAGTFQGWNPVTLRMGPVIDTSGIYEYEAYLPLGNYEFKYVNGNTVGDYEALFGSCATNGNRTMNLTQDTMLDPVNFGSCLVGISENELTKNIQLYPNPASSFVMIEFNDNNISHTVSVSDITGRIIRTYSDYISDALKIERGNLLDGVYIVSIINREGGRANTRLIIE